MTVTVNRGAAGRGAVNREGRGSGDVQLTPFAVADWLLRDLLPDLLWEAGEPGAAVRVQSLGPVTGESFGDRYAHGPASHVLRDTREALGAALLCERRFAQQGDRLVSSPGRSVAMLPQLAEIIEHVAGSFRPSQAGALTGSCVALAVAVCVAGQENDTETLLTAAPAIVRAVYDAAIARLVERAQRPSSTNPASSEPASVVPAPRASTGREAFHAQYRVDGEFRTCTHRHATMHTARDCARRLSVQWARRGRAA